MAGENMEQTNQNDTYLQERYSLAMERIEGILEEKKYSANQIASAVLGVLSVIVLAGLLGISFLKKGMANTWIGAVGFTGIVMAVCGLWYGFAGFKDDSKSYFCSKCGTILSTVAIAGWFFIVCLGLAG